MFEDNFVRKATVIRVIDGDTVQVMVDNGYRRYSIERIRVNRINAPEMKGKSKAAGLASKQFVESLLKPNDNIYIKSTSEDAFGRWVGEIYFSNGDLVDVNLSDLMLAEGMAVPFVK